MLKNNVKFSPEALDQIKDAANDNIDLILSSLGIDIDSVTTCGNEIRSICPLHEGADNPTAFCYNTTYKYWRCYTRGCSEGCGNIFGLVQKMLQKNENKRITFTECVSWLSKTLNLDIEVEEIEIDEYQRDLNQLIRSNKKINKDVKLEDKFNAFPFDIIRNKVTPSKYFIEEGFSEEILTKYCVGFCNDPNKPMYMRSYAPILNEAGTMVIGVTGRTIHKKCIYCGEFHIEGKGCPADNPKVRGYPKWKHFGFHKSHVFYNLNFAKPYIERSRTVILTEGPKDVWWLEQHGVHNSLCIFGLSVSNLHLKRLISLGVLKVVVALDRDEPGLEAMEKINEKLSDYFVLYNINQFLGQGQDIADIPSEKMLREVVPHLKSIEAKY